MTKRKEKAAAANTTPPENTPESRGPDGKWAKGAGSPNPGGRPKSKVSLTYWVNEFLGMTGMQLSRRLHVHAREFAKLGDDVPVIANVAASLIASQINDPDARMIGLLFDRLDGKLAQSFKWEDDLVAWLRDNAETLKTDAAERARVVRILREGNHDVSALFGSIGLSVVVGEDAE